MSVEKKINIVQNIMQIVMMIALVLGHASVWTREGINYIDVDVANVVALLLAIASFVLHAVTQKSVRRTHMKMLAIGLVLIFFVLLTGNKDFMQSLYRVCAPAICFFLFAVTIDTSDKQDKVWRNYIYIITAIAVISLFFYIFASTFHLIKPSATVKYQWDYVRKAQEYFGLYYERQMFASKIYRNSGIFTEAVMFCFLLIPALAANEFIVSKKNTVNKIISIVLLLTVITTLTVSGFICIIIIYGYKLISLINIDKIKNNRVVRFVVLPAVLVLLAVGVIFILKRKSGTLSYAIRMEHFIKSFEVLIETGLAGCGIGNNSAMLQNMKYAQGISIGWPYLLAQGGLCAGLLAAFPIWFFMANKKWKINKDRMIVFAVFAWLLISTNVFYRQISWFFVMTVFLPDVGIGREITGGEQKIGQ